MIIKGRLSVCSQKNREEMAHIFHLYFKRSTDLYYWSPTLTNSTALISYPKVCLVLVEEDRFQTLLTKIAVLGVWNGGSQLECPLKT